MIADASNAVWDCYICKITTAFKCITADVRDAIRYRDARKATAIKERKIVDARYTIWNNQFGNQFAIQI